MVAKPNPPGSVPADAPADRIQPQPLRLGFFSACRLVQINYPLTRNANVLPTMPISARYWLYEWPSQYEWPFQAMNGFLGCFMNGVL